MDGNNTDQDKLLSQISELTSGLSSSIQSEPASAPVSTEPVQSLGPVQPMPAPSMQAEPVQTGMPSMPAMNEAPQMSAPIQNPAPTLGTPIQSGAPTMGAPNMINDGTPHMPGASSTEMPVFNNSAPADPFAAAPQSAPADPFAASLGATPVSPEMPQAEAPAGIPSMDANPTSRIPVPDNKVPTFDEIKTTKKKSNGGFIFIVVLFLVIILGLLCFFGYQKGLFDKFFKPKQIEEPIIEPEPIVEPEPEITATFVNETNLDGVKDKFIDASYRMDGLDYYNNYIKVPYINMESDDAKKVNNEIIEKYKEYANISAEYKKENEAAFMNYLPGDPYVQKYLLVGYQKIVNGDIVSLLFNELNSDGVTPVWNHYAYNFNLKTGKLMTLSELETMLTVDDKQMNAALELYMPQLMAKLTSAEGKAKFEDKINAFRTLQKYYQNLNDGVGIDYYVDGAKRINIITTVYVGEDEVMKLLPYGKGTFDCKSLDVNGTKKSFNFEERYPDGYVPDSASAQTPTQLVEPQAEVTTDNNNTNTTEAVDKTASSNIQTKETLSPEEGDVVSGKTLKAIFVDKEKLIGQEKESLSFRVELLNDSVKTRSYTKGQINDISSYVKDNYTFKVQTEKYQSGAYRILTFVQII